MALSYGESTETSVQMEGPFGTAVAKNKMTQIHLPADGWKGAISPYTQTVSVDGISTSSRVDLNPTHEQIEQMHSMDIALMAENISGDVTVYAIGDKPEMDMTIQATIMEVSNDGSNIIGNTVGMSAPRADWLQEDPKMADFIRNKLKLIIGSDEPEAPAIWFQASAEGGNGTLVFVAPDGNKYYMFPNTKMECVSGLTEAMNKLLPKAGGSMTGNLGMSGNRVTGLGTPTDSGDATNKEYVDGKRVVFTATIPASGWSGSAPYTNRVSIGGIIASDMPHITPVYSTTQATAISQREAWGFIAYGVAGSNAITFTALEDKPAVDIPIQIEVNR